MPLSPRSDHTADKSRTRGRARAFAETNEDSRHYDPAHSSDSTCSYFLFLLGGPLRHTDLCSHALLLFLFCMYYISDTHIPISQRLRPYPHYRLDSVLIRHTVSRYLQYFELSSRLLAVGYWNSPASLYRFEYWAGVSYCGQADQYPRTFYRLRLALLPRLFVRSLVVFAHDALRPSPCCAHDVAFPHCGEEFQTFSSSWTSVPRHQLCLANRAKEIGICGLRRKCGTDPSKEPRFLAWPSQ